MKRQLHILMVVVVTLFANAAQAQTNSPRRVVAQIPFAFNVGKTTLPAGKYTISVVNPSSDRTVLQIRSDDGQASAMILTNDEHRRLADNAKLVFERYDDRYFFAEAQMAGEATSFAAVRSKAEHKEMLAKAARKTVIVITVG
ncbi:MAG TPA: hypothetical protein VHS05_28925 [Pyrinomonadaceae bacterium]|nr:hypothetical protein [Pyrinomonadaceae bacterium]